MLLHILGSARSGRYDFNPASPHEITFESQAKDKQSKESTLMARKRGKRTDYESAGTSETSPSGMFCGLDKNRGPEWGRRIRKNWLTGIEYCATILS